MTDEQLARRIALRRGRLIEKARRGHIIPFTQVTFPKYDINWHHLVTGHYIDKLISGEIKRLILLEPPRHGKTELSSRRLPPLLHGLFPDDEILAITYNGELASEVTIDVQRIMDTDRYKEIFPNSRITPEGELSKFKRNSNEHELMPYWKVVSPNSGGKQKFWPQGSYRSAGIGGSLTGRGGNWILVDDPVKNRKDADSKAFRDHLWDFYTSTVRTRLEKDARIFITLTQWHNDDLAGRLLKLAKSDPTADQWTVVRLPAIKEVEGENDYDLRKVGEPLWPGKFTLDDLLATKASVGSRDWSALYQQRPVAEGGNIIQTDWIRYYTVLPQRFDQLIQSWDFATKDKTSSDYAVGQVWGRVASNFYLIHQMRGRWPFPMACKKLIDMSRMYPDAYKKAVEAKANGPAVVQTLRQTVPGIVEVEPQGDKVARLNAVAPLYEAGQVWYPHPDIAPWINDHISELINFPLDVNDDQVDAASQALNILRSATPMHMPISGHGSGLVF